MGENIFKYSNVRMVILKMDKTNLMLELPAQIFTALGHPVRLAMLEVLRGGEACVCHIQAVLGIRQAYASQHLNVLRQAGLLNSRKDGTRVYYQLVSPGLLEILDQAKDLLIRLDRASEKDFDPIMDLAHPECTCPQCTEEYVPHEVMHR